MPPNELVIPAEIGPHNQSGWTEVSKTTTTPITRNAASPNPSQIWMRAVPRRPRDRSDSVNRLAHRMFLDQTALLLAPGYGVGWR